MPGWLVAALGGGVTIAALIGLLVWLIKANGHAQADLKLAQKDADIAQSSKEKAEHEADIKSRPSGTDSDIIGRL